VPQPAQEIEDIDRFGVGGRRGRLGTGRGADEGKNRQQERYVPPHTAVELPGQFTSAPQAVGLPAITRWESTVCWSKGNCSLMSEQQIAFKAFAERKTREATTATIRTLTTVFDRSGATSALFIGNPWTRSRYGGDFGLVVTPAVQTYLSLVFVQSHDRNTGSADPSAFGGGDTDKHLVYEGLSRVAADAVLVGGRTVHPNAFFSVWHPELVALRQSLGLPRHPAQIVVSKHGDFDFTSLLFNVPDVPVFLIAGEQCLVRHAAAIRARPWVTTIPLDDRRLTGPIDQLRRDNRIQRISAVGGRSTATRLVDDGLAQDIYLTTGSREGGDPETPWYGGTASLALTVTTRKVWSEADVQLVFEHILIA
jgi:riboflavin biosynthesis pyrimidine reductase